MLLIISSTQIHSCSGFTSTVYFSEAIFFYSDEQTGECGKDLPEILRLTHTGVSGVSSSLVATWMANSLLIVEII